MESIFKLYGWEVFQFEQLHQGLINTTYIVNTASGDYILQSVNHTIFKSPSYIDDNITKYYYNIISKNILTKFYFN